MSLMPAYDGHQNWASARTTPGPSAGLLFHLAVPVILLCPLVLEFYWPVASGLDATGHQITRDFINVWADRSSRLGHAYQAAIGVLFGQPLPFHNWSYPPGWRPSGRNRQETSTSLMTRLQVWRCHCARRIPGDTAYLPSGKVRCASHDRYGDPVISIYPLIG
jgi:hypothetical protein